MGNNPVIYTKMDWVDKEVLIIPVGMNVTDRWIQKKWNNTIKNYDITIESDTVLKKTVKIHNNVGRVYVPKELIGYDCLVVESPNIENF